jgi:hypothetical protein
MDAHTLLPELLRQRQRMLGCLRRRVTVAADAEDLFQQALVRATAHAHTLEDPERGCSAGPDDAAQQKSAKVWGLRLRLHGASPGQEFFVVREALTLSPCVMTKL